MQFFSLFYWGPLNWCKFWLGNNHNISLKGVSLTLRSTNYLAKVADLAMAWEVLVDRVYDYYPLSDSDIVLDIGGHIGSFSAKAALQVPHGRVFVCEPFPDTFVYLSKNVAGFSHVTPNQVAISDHNGTDTLYYSDSNPAENSLVRQAENAVDVRISTMADFFHDTGITHVDLMKIDCEGAEYDILFASESELSKIEKIVMEIHEPKYFGLSDRFSIQSMVDLLERNNFDVTFKRENKFQGYIYAHKTAATN
jgi:FkbM family methyltransferase